MREKINVIKYLLIFILNNFLAIYITNIYILSQKYNRILFFKLKISKEIAIYSLQIDYFINFSFLH